MSQLCGVGFNPAVRGFSRGNQILQSEPNFAPKVVD